MALFTRRVLARCIDECRSIVSENTVKDWVSRLNRISEDYAATEWEIALIRGFSSLGKIEHEPETGGRTLDIVFTAEMCDLRFGADVVAVSDRSLNQQNPVQPFLDELAKVLKRERVETGGFFTQFFEQSPTPSKFSRRKRKILLPPRNLFHSHVFNAEFRGFLDRVRLAPDVIQTHFVRNVDPPINISIQYQPARRGSGGATYGAYTSTTVIDDNPFYKALRRKACQIKQSGFDGLSGIIACDADSRIFTSQSSWAEFSIEDVVQHFLKKYTSVGFVVTIAVKSDVQILGRFEKAYRANLHVRKGNEEWVRPLGAILDRVIVSMPKINVTPSNVSFELQRSIPDHRAGKWKGKWTMTAGGGPFASRTVTFSSRELLDLLAGKLSQRDFLEHHKIGREEGSKSVFGLIREQGRMIESVQLVKKPDEDDDEIVLRFGWPDPAVANFQVDPAKIEE